jgi:hypothetical protein
VSVTVTNAYSKSDTETKAAYILVAFPDVPSDDDDWAWAFDEVIACVDAEIVKGYTDGTYRPTKPVSRAELATYIARALCGGDDNVPDGPAEATFVDVATDYWGFKYIEYAVDQEIVQGYDATHYQPEAYVGRAQMAVFVARAKGWVNIGDDMNTAPELFSDVPAGFWCGTAIQACVDHNVVQGYEGGTYKPTEIVGRAQMAVYMARAFELL